MCSSPRNRHGLFLRPVFLLYLLLFFFSGWKISSSVCLISIDLFLLIFTVPSLSLPLYECLLCILLLEGKSHPDIQAHCGFPSLFPAWIPTCSIDNSLFFFLIFVRIGSWQAPLERQHSGHQRPETHYVTLRAPVFPWAYSLCLVKVSTQSTSRFSKV